MKDQAENRQELPSLQVRGQSQLSGNTSNGNKTLSPTNATANRNRILEINQQMESKENGFHLSEDLLTPISPGRKNRLG